MPKIFDNIDFTFNEGLNSMISCAGVKRLDLCVGYFNLRGWNLISDEVDKLCGEEIEENDEKIFRTCRLMIGMYRPPEDLIREFYSTSTTIVDSDVVRICKAKIAADFRKQLTLGAQTKEDETTLRHLSEQLGEGKVCVKLYLKAPLHAKLYLAYRIGDSMNPIPAIMGSSNLTYSGLNREGELNAEFGDSDGAQKLANWFCDRWEDRFCVDISDELKRVIDTSWASAEVLPPYYIYLKTAYLLSADARSGLNEYTLPIEFKKDLFEFQATAVKMAAKHIDNPNKGGAIIGDVVGLGKTITACAIIKMLEMQHAFNTLIICPANLQEMWNGYVRKYDLKADVMSMAKTLDAEHSKHYRLLVIDESHNLRNKDGKRYRNIKQFIDFHNCKVLMLTATPYNKDFSDLSNQLRLFIKEDQDLGIRPEALIKKMGNERNFLQQYSEVFIRSIKAFEKSESIDDWQDLMRLFLVRRTRTFIKENYAKMDNDRYYLKFPDGTKNYFPERRPITVRFKTTPGDQYSRLYSESMIDLMDSLQLPRYGLMKYLDKVKSEAASDVEKQILDNLSRAGNRIMGFCKSTFFKRIDSDGISFLLTVQRHIMRNCLFIYAIEQGLPLPIGDENTMPEDFTEDADFNASIFSETSEQNEVTAEEKGLIHIPTDLALYKEKAKDYYSQIESKNSTSISWLSPEYFKRSLKATLKNDCDTLIEMIKLCEDWNPTTDEKLNELQRLLTETHKEDKVLVFTQYSDTANYIYEQLKERGIKQIDCATGGSANPTDTAKRFSPVSNEVQIPAEQQTRILISTDVLSEGQNLQDAHVIINFDLPWAIIRLIQRAGRVDRIGQKSEVIDCYSFFPADGVEEIINLRNRLNDRININAGIVGSDEKFFEGNSENLMNIYNEKSGVLDDEEDMDVDLASQAYQIWKNATDARPLLREIIPTLCDGAYSTKANNGNPEEEGVITYAKTFNGNDVLTWINRKNEIVTQSQSAILAALRCTYDEPVIEPLDEHLKLVTAATDEIKKLQATQTSGILGSTFSTKYRIVNLMENYIRNNGIFATDDLKEALDDIYNNVLQENAKYTLGQLLKRSTSVEEIKEYILDLHSRNLLVIKPEEGSSKDPKLLCSMGVKNVD